MAISTANNKRLLLMIVGTSLGLIFLYLAFRDVSWNDFVNGLKQIDPVYLLPSALLMIAIQFIRAVRFGLILNPLCRMRTKDLWDMLNLWAGASMILPIRLGELVRPYLLRQRGATFSSGVGAVMVERFFDLSGLLFLLGIVLWTNPQVPAFYSYLGLGLVGALAVGYSMVLLILTRREAFQTKLDRILSLFPERAARFLSRIIKLVIDGFGIMASFRQALIIFAFSVLIWILFSCVTYLFLLSFSVKAPFLVAVTIQVFICFGVALPSAPGFVGTFHAAGRYALALFGIQTVVAISFATVYHLFALVMSLALGLASYLTCSFRFDQSLFSGSSDPSQ
ncbi:MAG: flippase-like domain-containing protein [Desulfomonile tiedjei]|uniref:Flippase-like domain-containing protein n=1 Tax=Desulfomonile tiedjei TaxID=2358 RepID=A0A9D6Z490_9BACT|nr:flippase-like domain-containing protein [Desulfomonile tiedjei]